jgi:2-hydroxychromene-2-carboxylate isomerase
VPFGKRSKAHVAYFFGREIERWSEVRGAPTKTGIPTHHAKDPALANGMLIAGLGRGIDIDGLAHAILEAHWRDDADLADRLTLASIGRSVGVDPDSLLDRATTPEVQQVYRANTEEAVRRSVFGSPTCSTARIVWRWSSAHCAGPMSRHGRRLAQLEIALSLA